MNKNSEFYLVNPQIRGQGQAQDGEQTMNRNSAVCLVNPRTRGHGQAQGDEQRHDTEAHHDILADPREHERGLRA